jgi:acyl-CoA oxidase
MGISLPAPLPPPDISALPMPPDATVLMHFAGGALFAVVLIAIARVYCSVRQVTRQCPSWKHECCHGISVELPDTTTCQPMIPAPTSGLNDDTIRALESKLHERFCKIMPDHEAISDDEEWRVSADRLSRMLRQDYLSVDELHGSEAFFAAHRVLAKLRLGSLGIRLTVQYNLFAGTIGAIGSAEQIEWLHAVQKAGDLGCFLLTERSAGVLSGFIVETAATWDAARKRFVLSTPGGSEEAGATKMWISQGLAARWGVCIARLVLGGKEMGQHGFIVDMEAAGVKRGTMGEKTSFNALDSAFVQLHDVELPHSALLSKYCSMSADGQCVRRPNLSTACAHRCIMRKQCWSRYTSAGDSSFLVVAQRLLSGRICISDAAITYFGTVLDEAEAYCSRRLVWVDKEQQMPLRSLPYMQTMFTRFHAAFDMHRMFLLWLQTQYRAGLQKGQIDRDTATLIAAAKIEAVEFTINAVHLLRRNVGAYGLMADGPFGATNEILLCARFAEGDSRILQQMIVRDLIRKYRSPRALAGLVAEHALARLQRCLGRRDTLLDIQLMRQSLLLRLLWFLRRSVQSAPRSAAGKPAANAQLRAWLQAADLVYDLAKIYAHELIVTSVVQHFGVSGNAERFSLMAVNDCEMCHQY